jgi:serine/threonine-protein kinase
MTSQSERLNTALAGRYRIERHLGEGGMAMVYLAHDLKHDRKVALKLLRPELAAVLGAERFVQEIKTTAALQHPHILPLFDSGTADGFLFYVMPYIEGETLRDKLSRETQLGVDESVRIAREVADALDYAHRHGVIHRDIKPENILLHDGRPMVADFGIALAVSAAAGGRMTETGLSLGTPFYMSPEQATADKDITGRSDVYSLASVLYEMLAGQPPHLGGSAQQIIMKIIAEPVMPVTKLRKSVPPNVSAALSKALEKLPADRFESAKAFSSALSDTGFTTATTSGAQGFVPRGLGSRAIAGIAAGFVMLLGVALWGWLRPTAPPPVIRYVMLFDPGSSSSADLPTPLPSPDGSFMAFVGPIGGSQVGTQLWMKRRDQAESTPIPGTISAQSFSISPNGEWLAFMLGTLLEKVQLAAGKPVVLLNNGNANGGSAWLDDGTIVYTKAEAPFPTVWAVSSSGGPAALVWRSDSAAGVFPSPIHGKRAVLFNRCTAIAVCDLWALDLSTKNARALLPGVMGARHSTSGHLVYPQDSRLMAVGFDASGLKVRGTPVPLADSAVGFMPLELSTSGTMVTRTSGDNSGNAFDMVWVDRAGRVTPVDTAWRFRVTQFGNDHGWRLSPDGRRLAIGLFTDAGDDIWVKELPRGPVSRVSFDPAAEARPNWTPDSRAVTFFSSRAKHGIYMHRADGAGKDSLILAGFIDEAQFSPDGSWLVLRDGSNGSVRGGRDLKGARIGKDTTRIPLIVTRFDEEAIALSHNGKWIAYQSDETGQTEIFIRSFPNTDAVKKQISNGGGEAPVWSRDGREIFYPGAGKNMMSARITEAPQLTVSEPTTLFRVPDELLAVEYEFYTPWDVAADGRFIMARLRRSGNKNMLTAIVAENWLTELKAKMKH